MTPFFQDPQHWDQFQTALLSWLRTPYCNMVAKRGRGADCTLFIGQVLVDCNWLTNLDIQYMPHDWFLHDEQELVLQLFRNHGRYLQPHITFHEIAGVPENPLCGDIFLLNLSRTKPVHHAGVYLGDDRMIHCSPHAGVHTTWFKNWFMARTRYTIRLMEQLG